MDRYKNQIDETLFGASATVRRVCADDGRRERENMKTLEKVKIEKLSFPINGVYNYNAMIFRSVDSGKTFCYCGYGKYCKTLEEAEAYKNEIETA